MSNQQKQLEATLKLLLNFQVDEDNDLHAELASFLVTNNINLASETQELNYVLSSKPTKGTVSPLLTFLNSCGCTIAASTVAKGFGTLTTSEGYLPMEDLTYYDMIEQEDVSFFDASIEQLEGVLAIRQEDLANFVMDQVAEKLSALTPDVLAKMFSLLTYGVELEGSKVVYAANYGGLELDFATGEFTVGNTTKQATKKVNINGTRTSTLGILFLLGAEIIKLGHDGLWRGEGILNEVPGLWDDEQNYGIVANDSNKFLKKGQAKAIQFTSNRMVEGFPYYAITNATLQTEKLKWGNTILTDKVASKTEYDEDAANSCGIFGATVSYKSKDGTKKTQKGQHTINDTGAKANKASKIIEVGAKLLNRISQSFKYQGSDLCYANADGSLSSTRSVSKFGTKIMSSGKACMMEGQMVKIALTNMSISSGSGVAVMNPKFAVYYGLDKTISTLINFTDCTGEVEAKYNNQVTKEHANYYAFLKDVENVLADIPKDKVFAPGEDIASFDYGNGNVKPLFSNKFNNQYLLVTGYKVKPPKITKNGHRPSHVSIKLKVKAVKEVQFAKFRTAGLKATTVVSPQYKWFDAAGNEVGYPADIVYNNETRKGNVSELVMYANTAPNIKSAIVEGDDAGCRMVVNYDNTKKIKKIDLFNPKNEVSEWVNATTEKMKVQVTMPKVHYDFALESAISAGYDEVTGKGFDFKWKLVQDLGNGAVIVEEDIEVLVGYMPLNFEISTADEAVSESNLTPEMMAGMALICPSLVDALYNEALPARQALFGLLNMVTYSDEEYCYSFNAQDTAELKAFQALIPDLNGKNDRQICSIMEKSFPDGLVIHSNGANNKSKLLIDWATVNKTMTFIGGTADQISQEIVGAIKFLADASKTLGVSGIDSKINAIILKLANSLKGWVLKGLQSKGLIKKLSRSSKCLVNGKVRTVYNLSLIPDSDGVPKVLINPYCGMSKMLAKNADHSWNERYLVTVYFESKEDYKANFVLPSACIEVSTKNMKAEGYEVKYFNPYLLNNSVVAAVRIPMFMPAMCKVVVTTEIEPSHVGILPCIWAQGNSGDSDGDGIGLINCTIRGLTIIDAIKANKSIVGLAGYKMVYASSKLPFSDFVESPAKKNLLRPDGFAYASFLPHEDVDEYAFNTEFGHVGLKGIHINTSNHYKYSVGTGYGIASAITCWAAVKSYDESFTRMDLLEKAILVIWTLIYEGLGLSGYSAKAAEFFNVLRVASLILYDNVPKGPLYSYAIDENGTILPRIDKKVSAEKLELHDAIDYMLSALDLPTDSADWTAVMEIICDFNHYRMTYGKLDKNELSYEDLEKLKDFKVSRIAMVGMFRHMGRGIDPSTGLELIGAEEGDMFTEYMSSIKLVESHDYHNELLPEGSWMNKLYLNGINFMTQANKKLLASVSIPA